MPDDELRDAAFCDRYTLNPKSLVPGAAALLHYGNRTDAACCAGAATFLKEESTPSNSCIPYRPLCDTLPFKGTHWAILHVEVCTTGSAWADHEAGWEAHG
jgi:hypothetical protein